MAVTVAVAGVVDVGVVVGGRGVAVADGLGLDVNVIVGVSVGGKGTNVAVGGGGGAVGTRVYVALGVTVGVLWSVHRS